MKLKEIKKAAYVGESVSKAFITGFQIQLLETLHKRDYLSERQLLKSLSILQERSR